MPKCRDNRLKKKIRRRKELVEKFHQYHLYVSWCPPYNYMGQKKVIPSQKIRKHFDKQLASGNLDHLKVPTPYTIPKQR